MQTVTAHRVTNTGLDAYGNPVYTYSSEIFTCNVAWGSTGQNPTANRSAQDSSCELYIHDKDFLISCIDYFEIDGIAWINDGQVQVWISDGFGYVGTVVHLRRRDG